MLPCIVEMCYNITSILKVVSSLDEWFICDRWNRESSLEMITIWQDQALWSDCFYF